MNLGIADRKSSHRRWGRDRVHKEGPPPPSRLRPGPCGRGHCQLPGWQRSHCGAVLANLPEISSLGCQRKLFAKRCVPGGILLQNLLRGMTGEAAGCWELPGTGEAACDTGAGAGERHTDHQNQEAKRFPPVPSTDKA